MAARVLFINLFVCLKYSDNQKVCIEIAAASTMKCVIQNSFFPPQPHFWPLSHLLHEQERKRMEGEKKMKEAHW